MTRLLLSLLFALIASPAWAAIVQDATSQGSKDATGTTLDVSHTATGTTTDGLLVVLCSLSTSGATTITGINWDQGGTPVALTQHVTVDFANSSVRSDAWYLKLPATGTKTIRVTQSAGQIMFCKARTYTGVDQTAPLGTAVNHDLASGTTLTVDVTSTTAGNEVIEQSIFTANPFTQTIGANQTLIGTEQAQTGLEENSSSEPAGGTITMSWTWSGNDNCTMLAMEVRAPATGRRAVAPIILD